MLDVVRDRTARGLDSNVTSEDRTSVQGQDARRLRMESTLGGDTVRSEAMVIRGRTEGRVYVLIVQPRSGSPRDDDTRRFFDSFHML